MIKKLECIRSNVDERMKKKRYIRSNFIPTPIQSMCKAEHIAFQSVLHLIECTNTGARHMHTRKLGLVCRDIYPAQYPNDNHIPVILKIKCGILGFPKIPISLQIVLLLYKKSGNPLSSPFFFNSLSISDLIERFVSRSLVPPPLISPTKTAQHL